jgi:hypothetical protein
MAAACAGGLGQVHETVTHWPRALPRAEPDHRQLAPQHLEDGLEHPPQQLVRLGRAPDGAPELRR